MITVADRDEVVKKLLAQPLVGHDAADPLGAEGVAIVIREHRHDRHPRSAHGSQRLLVDPHLQTAGLGIDEEPLQDDHVEVLHVLLEGAQGVSVPVDIPGGAHAEARVSPLVDELLREALAMPDETVGVVIMLLVGVVHTLFQEMVTQRAVGFCQLGVAHERLRGSHHPTVVVTERHVRTALQGKHGDENDEQQHDDGDEEPHRPLKPAPTTAGVGLKHLSFHGVNPLNTIFR